MSEKLLDPKEVAARLNITEEQVRAFARDGDLKFINMGRGASGRGIGSAPLISTN